MENISANLILDFPNEFKTFLFVLNIFLIFCMFIISGVFLTVGVLAGFHCKYLNRQAYSALNTDPTTI